MAEGDHYPLDELEPRKRGPKVKWNFSQEMADLICRKIVEGGSIEDVCAEEGMPGRYVVSKWRHQNPDFHAQLKQARCDRAEWARDEALKVARTATKETIAEATLLVSVLKWTAQVDDPGTFGQKVKITNDVPPTIIMIDTGISRPGDPGYEEKPAIEVNQGGQLKNLEEKK